MAIKNANVTTAATSIYTSSGNSAITTIHLCNYTGIATQVNVYVVPSGFTANTINMIYCNQSILAGTTYIIDSEKLILSNGDSIYANASANVSVGGTISYIGI